MHNYSRDMINDVYLMFFYYVLLLYKDLTKKDPKLQFKLPGT